MKRFTTLLAALAIPTVLVMGGCQASGNSKPYGLKGSDQRHSGEQAMDNAHRPSYGRDHYFGPPR